jgi:hypothetical protein
VIVASAANVIRRAALVGKLAAGMGTFGFERTIRRFILLPTHGRQPSPLYRARLLQEIANVGQLGTQGRTRMALSQLQRAAALLLE